MADDLPYATPEKGGDIQPAANATTKEHDSQPKDELEPTNCRIEKRAGLTKLEWGGFFADLYVTLWVWSDLVGCHEIKRLIFLLATVFVAHGVLCYFIFKILASWRWAAFVWITLCVGASSVMWNNSRPLHDIAAVAKLGAPPQTNTFSWLPPELPKDSKNVKVYFGGKPYEMSVDRLKTNTSNNPFNSKTWLPFAPFIKDNRLYLEIEWFGKSTVIMSDYEAKKMNSELGWDLNCSTNAVEVVRAVIPQMTIGHDNRTVFMQVIYLRPDEIMVNGIFFHNNEYWVAFPPWPLHGTNAPPEEKFSHEPLFKYPSWKYPGEYVE